MIDFAIDVGYFLQNVMQYIHVVASSTNSEFFNINFLFTSITLAAS